MGLAPALRRVTVSGEEGAHCPREERGELRGGRRLAGGSPGFLDSSTVRSCRPRFLWQMS